MLYRFGWLRTYSELMRETLKALSNIIKKETLFRNLNPDL